MTGDVSTSQRHFVQFTAMRSSPGVILIPPATAIGEAIDRLLMLWLSSAAEDIENQVWWLPAMTP